MTDSPNARAAGSPYEAVDPAAARRPVGKVEWHDPPEHGGWPNATACEFPVPTRRCPGRRAEGIGGGRRRVGARDDRRAEADWRFTTAGARVTLRRLDPPTRQ